MHFSIDMAENPVHRERSRHIDVKVHNVRELQDDEVLKLKKVKGMDNVADALTKSLPSAVHLCTPTSLALGQTR